MRSRTIAIIAGSLVLLFGILLAVSRNGAGGDADLDLERQSFGHKDKKPGGCYVMYKLLPGLYDREKPQVMTKPFARSYLRDEFLGKGRNGLYILVTNNLFVTKEDVRDMISYVTAGNQLFIAANNPDSLLLAELAIAVDSADVKFSGRQCEEHYVNPQLAPDTLFSRSGIYGGRYFSRLDTSVTTILGTGAGGGPNFIRISMGNGHLFLLLNPSSLTNYFLMHGNNLRSLERQAAYTNAYPSRLYWDEYYKYQNVRQSGDFNEWQVLMRYPAMKWALWLAVLLLLLYVIFESKRRQRIIPEQQALTNNSLEFVDALGQLYYQQHDNSNLARKITGQWLEYIRSRFYLSTSHLNPAFIETLAHKSGMPVATVQEIVESIHHIQLSGSISDDYLRTFYKNIQAFYLNTK